MHGSPPHLPPCVLQQDGSGNVEILPEDSVAAGAEATGGEETKVAGEAGRSTEAVKLTTKYMTKYERARVIGTRALQLRCAPRQAERWQRFARNSAHILAPIAA